MAEIKLICTNTATDRAVIILITPAEPVSALPTDESSLKC